MEAGRTFHWTAGATIPNGICRSMPASTTVQMACRVAEDRTRNRNKPTKAMRQRPQARIAAPASCVTSSIGILILPGAIFAPGKFFRDARETAKLAIVEKLAIDHSDD
jgi:hypothetical protein